jgi:hypothetical protein
MDVYPLSSRAMLIKRAYIVKRWFVKVSFPNVNEKTKGDES